jgi:membrane protein
MKTQLKAIFQRIKEFIKRDVWILTDKDITPVLYFFVQQVRMIVITVKGFAEDKVHLRASALTYYSLLSIVPVIAMLFGIASGFGVEKHIEKYLVKNFQGQQDVLVWLIDFANRLLENTQGGVVAGIGIVILLWTILKVLNHIESSFNDIWQIKKGRSLVRKLSDYFSMMMIAPIIFILASSLNVFVVNFIRMVGSDMSVILMVSPLLVKLTPYLLVWLLFTLVYMVMPNTKVSFKAALVAGIIAGTSFQLLQWGYIHFQVGVSKYNAIYGSFAALPLFIIWLRMSWLIVLFGAEMSFAYQNLDNYKIEDESLLISQYHKKTLTLLVTYIIINRFKEGEKPYSAEQIAHESGLPIRLVRNILYDLTEAGIISEAIVMETIKQRAYQPAIDINRLTVSYVLHKVEGRGADEYIKPADSNAYKKLLEIRKKMQEKVEKGEGDILLRDIAVS